MCFITPHLPSIYSNKTSQNVCCIISVSLKNSLDTHWKRKRRINSTENLNSKNRIFAWHMSNVVVGIIYLKGNESKQWVNFQQIKNGIYKYYLYTKNMKIFSLNEWHKYLFSYSCWILWNVENLLLFKIPFWWEMLKSFSSAWYYIYALCLCVCV